MQVDPLLGNVAFASAAGGWSFTLQSFAQLYCDVHGIEVEVKEFAKRCVATSPRTPPLEKGGVLLSLAVYAVTSINHK